MPHTIPSPAPHCPICLRSIDRETACAGCGWVLSAGPWLDDGTGARRAVFDERMTAARRRHDLTAAVRAAGYPDHADELLLTELLGMVRGGRPTSAEITAARGSATTATRPVQEVVPTLLPRLADAPAGSRTLTLLDIDPDGLTTCTLRSDRFGAPTPERPHRILWRTVLPNVPGDRAEARFWLAGGIGVRYPGGYEITPAIRSRILPDSSPATPDIVVLHRIPGWPAADAVAALFPFVAAVHGAALGAEFFRILAEHSPLRVDHGVIVVSTGRDGALRPSVHPLYRAGETAAAARPVRLPVRIPTATGELVIAVVAKPADAYAAPPAVGIDRWAVPAGTDTATLEFALAAPGVVTLEQPRGARPDAQAVAGWPALLERMPAHDQPPDHLLDLVFAVELGGAVATVTARRALIAAILEVIQRRHPVPAGVRVAILGYHDHRPRQAQPVLDSRGFGGLAQAAATCEQLAASGVNSIDAAPLEDAIAAARTLPWRAGPVCKRLVAIGARRPHPTRDDLAYRCPNGHDWRSELSALRASGVQTLAIWDPPAGINLRSTIGRQLDGFWTSFSQPHPTLRLGEGPARTTADVADLAAEHARLLGPETPLAPWRFPMIAAPGNQENI